MVTASGTTEFQMNAGRFFLREFFNIYRGKLVILLRSVSRMTIFLPAIHVKIPG